MPPRQDDAREFRKGSIGDDNWPAADWLPPPSSAALSAIVVLSDQHAALMMRSRHAQAADKCYCDRERASLLNRAIVPGVVREGCPHIPSPMGGNPFNHMSTKESRPSSVRDRGRNVERRKTGRRGRQRLVAGKLLGGDLLGVCGGLPPAHRGGSGAQDVNVQVNRGRAIGPRSGVNGRDV